MNQEKQDIQKLKEYILSCPDSICTKDSQAIRTCVLALDEQMKRLIRDEKLREKFRDSLSDRKSHMVVQAVDSNINMEEEDLVQVEKAEQESITVTREEGDIPLDSEWESIPLEDVEAADNNNQMYPSSILGETLAQKAISDMSESGTTVSTPISALALVLHSAIRSNLIGFKCTGIPEGERWISPNATSKKNTFAPPVRELSKGVFVPKDWEKHALSHGIISLRYRKDGMSSMVLHVSLVVSGNSDVPMASVRFGPLDNNDSMEMQFPLDQHINLQGLNAALQNSPSVEPSLFFKSLSILFTEFCQRADIGSFKEDGESIPTLDEMAMKYTMAIPLPVKSFEPDHYQPPPKRKESEKEGWSQLQALKRFPPSIDYAPTIQDDLIGGTTTSRGGDFPDDLLPTGFPSPNFAEPRFGSGEGMIGNLMGPNHPAFRHQFHPDSQGSNGDDDNGFLLPGGLGMQPRFDPVYPPGVGSHGRGRGGRGRGRGGRFSSGDPNPDHQRPPNDFNNNQFM